LAAHDLRSKDNREKGGVLWVFVRRDDPAVIEQLRAWGFELKPGKAWWHA
jgi:N6-adenosine-specific RNA methylase IME4